MNPPLFWLTHTTAKIYLTSIGCVQYAHTSFLLQCTNTPFPKAYGFAQGTLAIGDNPKDSVKGYILLLPPQIHTLKS